jgi:hypothetical protein
MLTKHPMSITGAIATHRRYILLALTSFVLFWVILYSYGDRIDLASIHYPGSHHSKENNTSITIDATKESDGALIPNYLHLIYALKDPKSSFNFHFKDYLSLYGAQHHWHPDRVYLHTNADKEALDRGRSGESGKWTQLILNHPNLIIHNIELQEAAGNGLTIQRMEAQTDFVRAKVLNDIGGYYIDFDVVSGFASPKPSPFRLTPSPSTLSVTSHPSATPATRPSSELRPAAPSTWESCSQPRDPR